MGNDSKVEILFEAIMEKLQEIEKSYKNINSPKGEEKPNDDEVLSSILELKKQQTLNTKTILQFITDRKPSQTTVVVSSDKNDADYKNKQRLNLVLLISLFFNLLIVLSFVIYFFTAG
jgi:hypothetical protein